MLQRVSALCCRFNITDGLHKWVLQRLGYTVEEFEEAMARPNPEDDKRRIKEQISQLKRAIELANAERKGLHGCPLAFG